MVPALARAKSSILQVVAQIERSRPPGLKPRSLFPAFVARLNSLLKKPALEFRAGQTSRRAAEAVRWFCWLSSAWLKPGPDTEPAQTHYSASCEAVPFPKSAKLSHYLYSYFVDTRCFQP
jgi:hypothetical protein